VSVVSGRVERVADIGLDQVDVIVSEWMGYALLFETMLDSVSACKGGGGGGGVVGGRAPSSWLQLATLPDPTCSPLHPSLPPPSPLPPHRLVAGAGRARPLAAPRWGCAARYRQHLRGWGERGSAGTRLLAGACNGAVLLTCMCLRV